MAPCIKNEKSMADIFEDDGTLACLGITKNEKDKKFTCKEEQQSNLVGKTFYVLDYFSGVSTKYGERYIFKIKFNLDDPETEARKVWTGSSDIQFILDKLREIDKFPRRVTLKKDGKNHYYFE